jgi:K+-transporting ATPase ATPase C chain
MKNPLFVSIRLTIVMLVVCCVLYTGLILGLGKFGTNNGKGEIIQEKGKSYFSNIGQSFTNDNYFYSRPSAVNYNAAGSGGSNKGPTNEDYLHQVQARIDTFLVHNPDVKVEEIPVDLITASGSGLDPNISVQAAKVQVKRISKIRGIAEGNIQQLILSNIEHPLMGFIGPEKVNVLKLNIELDKLSSLN